LVSNGLTKPVAVVEALERLAEVGDVKCVGFVLAEMFRLAKLLSPQRFNTSTLFSKSAQKNSECILSRKHYHIQFFFCCHLC
jgi:hypothetical protein